MSKKYILTEETKNVFGRTLYRIKAIKDFLDVKAGDLGGWIEDEKNLSQDDAAWVYNEACVYGEALVFGKARIFGEARVFGEACVYDQASVFGEARVCDQALVYDQARVFGEARVCDQALVYDQARVFGEARVCDQYDVFTISNIGSRNDTSTFFKSANGEILVVCGCFRGTISEFEAAVKKTHGDNKHAKVYLKAIELAKEIIEVN